MTVVHLKSLLLVLASLGSEATSYVNVGNHACPSNMTAVSSKAECVTAAEQTWPGGGCYQQPWSSIITTLSDGSAYPPGCIFETTEGSGCALLFQADGKAQECQHGHAQCRVLCKNCVGVGKPCNTSHNNCCEDQVGVPMQCVSMGGGPVCISGNGLFAWDPASKVGEALLYK